MQLQVRLCAGRGACLRFSIFSLSFSLSLPLKRRKRKRKREKEEKEKEEKKKKKKRKKKKEKMSRIGKYIETESRLVITRGGRRGGVKFGMSPVHLFVIPLSTCYTSYI